jgi:hypothetical protein
VVEESTGLEEDSIEEIFGQLWAIPDTDKARVPTTVRERRVLGLGS